MPLIASEVIEHPGFRSVVWDLPPTRKGNVSVARARGGPFDVAYEVHGSGPIHLVWIMGLAGVQWYWQRYTKAFGHDRSSKYSCLIFDNRGMGESDKPLLRYSTSEMAKDTLELLENLGWTEQRQLHIVGVSMGGMIAQELDRLLNAAFDGSTACKQNSMYSYNEKFTKLSSVIWQGYVEHLRSRMNILIPKSVDAQLAEVKSRVSESWLSEPDVDGIFPTNGDSFAARELTKRRDTQSFTRKGFLCQIVAAAWHAKSPEQLKQIANNVGRDRIQVVHGTIDNLITPLHAETLVQGLQCGNQEVTKILFKGRGHYLPLEECETLRRVLEAFIDKTEALKEP